MRKILVSLGVIVFVGAIAVGATGAFFSDSETSTGNTFSAGAIDLKVDATEHYDGLICVGGTWQQEESVPPTSRPELISQPCGGSWALTDLGPSNQFFNLTDIKPGDNGENTVSLHIDNNDAYACANITNVQNDDNGVNSPEASAGDSTPGLGQGELGQNLNFLIWDDTNGNNIWDNGEQLLTNGTAPLIDQSYTIADGNDSAITGGDTRYVGVAWCAGSFVNPQAGSPLVCDGATMGNITQTDSYKANVTFQVEQARNNSGFRCGSIEQSTRTVGITDNDLATSIQDVLGDGSKWFFYNDTNDTFMTLNQFSSDGGIDDMVVGPDSIGAAEMKLDSGTDPIAYVGNNIGNPRYNIATYQFSGIPLSSITQLGYRVYDGTADGDKPFLNFNVDFNGSDTWQKRLVYVPTALTTGVWTDVDAFQGGAAMWTYSGATWPAGNTSNGSITGTTARSWSDILLDYPSIRTRVTDSWLGIRVGEPGPVGATGFIDSFTIATGGPAVKYDFGN